jgi:hypothetical protein
MTWTWSSPASWSWGPAPGARTPPSCASIGPSSRPRPRGTFTWWRRAIRSVRCSRCTPATSRACTSWASSRPMPRGGPHRPITSTLSSPPNPLPTRGEGASGRGLWPDRRPGASALSRRAGDRRPGNRLHGRPKGARLALAGNALFALPGKDLAEWPASSPAAPRVFWQRKIAALAAGPDGRSDLWAASAAKAGSGPASLLLSRNSADLASGRPRLNVPDELFAQEVGSSRLG